MKKGIIAAVLVGVSALYVVLRGASALPGANAVSATTAGQTVTAQSAGDRAPRNGESDEDSLASDDEAGPLAAPSPAASKPVQTQTQTRTGSGMGMSGGSGMGNGMMGRYKDGTYAGSVADAYYGNVEVQAVVKNGQISDVKFLQYPDTHSTSVYINQQAMPMLTQEAIAAQSANVNIISGATATSEAFIQSLTAALAKA